METSVKYPGITVQLMDGNAFSIIARARHALRRGGISREECSVFVAEAMNGDYDHLLQTVMKWVVAEWI